MSQLSSLIIPSAVVKLGASELVLRGLQPSHLGWLYVSNKPVCDLMWTNYSQLKDPEKIGLAFAADFITAAPVLAAQVIALSTGALPTDPSWEADVTTAITIPISYQAECLKAIGTLTFSKEMPPKKLLAMFLQVIGQEHRKANQKTA